MKKFKAPINNIAQIDPQKKTWYEYLTATGEFEIVEDIEVNIHEHDSKYDGIILWLKPIDVPSYWPALYENIPRDEEVIEAMKHYEIFKTLNLEERKRALEITTDNIV